MGKIKAYLLVVKLSFKWIFIINLGDKIIYNKKIHIVCNGVRTNSWRLDNLDNGDEGWVNRKDCKKVKTFSNLIGSFQSGYRFYMGYWYDIWKRVGVEPWMRGCQIWGNH